MVNDRILGFVTGDIFVMTIINTGDIFATILLGFCGGLAGYLAKDIYTWIKNKLTTGQIDKNFLKDDVENIKKLLKDKVKKMKKK